MVNNCKNKRLQTLIEDEFKEMNRDIINEINNIENIQYYNILNEDLINNVIELEINFIDINLRMNNNLDLDSYTYNYYKNGELVKTS